MTAESSTTTARQPRRRWLQFSLRTLLVVMVPVAGVAAWVGSEIAKGKRQVAAIEWVKQQGVALYFADNSESRWQQRWIGEWYPDQVAHVDLESCEVDTIQPLEALEDLQALWIDSALIDDVSPLYDLHQLRFVSLIGTATSEEQIGRLKEQLPELIVDERDSRLARVRKNSDGLVFGYDQFGGTLWLFELPEELHPLAHMVAANGDLVFVATAEGLVAIDRHNGSKRWEITAEDCGVPAAANEHVLLTLHAESISGSETTWELAAGWSADNGEKLFDVRLSGVRDPRFTQAYGDLFVVPDGAIGFDRESYVLDSDGNIRCRLEGEVSGAISHGEDVICNTSSRWVCVSPSGQEKWSVAVHQYYFRGSADIELSHGDYLLCTFGPMSDSGVDVVRVEPDSGVEVWKTHCQGMNVGPHSEYYHSAFLVLHDDVVAVVSMGSHGRFVELLSAETGQQLSRWRFVSHYYR